MSHIETLQRLIEDCEFRAREFDLAHVAFESPEKELFAIKAKTMHENAAALTAAIEAMRELEGAGVEWITHGIIPRSFQYKEHAQEFLRSNQGLPRRLTQRLTVDREENV